MINILLINLLLISGSILSSLGIPAKAVEKVKAETGYITLYDSVKSVSTSMPSQDVFTLAVKGYMNLKKNEQLRRNLLSIIDFRLPSTEKRLWVIDMDSRKILYNDFVAHGKNSGDNLAAYFSNVPESNMSSMGFYITGRTYNGKHGLSLYLEGMDGSFNDNARKRAIVIHGASYVSQDYIRKYGRLGRSFGCPALSMESFRPIINSISEGSCLFIYYPDETYLANSRVLNL